MELPGGSPTASNTRLIIHFGIGSLNLGVLCALSNLTALSIISSITGYLLSLDWAHLIWYIRRRRVNKPEKENKDQSWTTPSGQLTIPLGGKKREFVFYILILLGILTLSLVVYLPHLEWFSTHGLESGETDANKTDEDSSLTADVSQDVPTLFKPYMVDSLWGCILALCVLMWGVHHFQKAYLFVWFKNPLTQQLKKPFLKLFLLTAYFIRCGGPFANFLFIHFLFGANVPKIPFGRTFENSAAVAVSYGFLFRQIWQFPEHSLVAVGLFYAVEKIGGTALASSPWWGGIPLPIRVHVFCLLFKWIRDTWKKLKTVFSLSWTSVFETKQRKIINFFLVGINLGILPVLAGLSGLASVLCLPLFPLFTLPLFLVGFPRPVRFWSYPVGYSANRCSDTVYYEQLTPYVTKGFHLRALCGGLGLTYPGEIFLLRWEDRLLWVQILEIGFIHFTYSFKGLELQETSCHTTEASRVDSIFSRAFDSNFSAGSCNPFYLHTIEPLCTVAAVGYSETRNVLTGVIDSPDTLDVVRDYFLKTLVYYLLYFAYSNNGSSSPALSRPASVISRLASADITTRKAFASLPKAERVENGSRVTVYSASGEDSASLKSQSGRGSRLAWVSGSRVGGGAPVGTSKRDGKVGGASVQAESIREEREAVLRSASWASTEGSSMDQKPLAYYEAKKKGEEESVFGTHFGRRETSSEDSKYKVHHPSKAKTYVKRLESPVKGPKRMGSNESDLISDSDPESENTRELFMKSLTQKQFSREREPYTIQVQSSEVVTDDPEPVILKNPSSTPVFQDQMYASFPAQDQSPVPFHEREPDGTSGKERTQKNLRFKDQSTTSILLNENEDSNSLNLKDNESDSLSLTEDLINKKSRRRSNGQGGCIPAYKTSLSVSLSPRLNWIVSLPFDEEVLEDLQDYFPLSWFKFLLKHFGMLEIEETKAVENNKEVNLKDERLIEQLLADEFLEESYRTLVALCHIIMLGTDANSPTTNRVYKIFIGELPKLRGSEWLKSRKSLLEIALKAFRVAVKLSLDHTLVGPVNNCWTDLEAALEEYNSEWFVGPDMDTPLDAASGAKEREGDESWAQSVKKEVPSLFSLGYNESKEIYTSHLLTLGEAEVNVGRLEDETVRAIWASLSGELLYLTNDDDERYSIQAHPVLLRNLTIQAADPPLGYPIYSSPPISLSFK